MFFGFNILIHILFIASMVFIIGYVFGSFWKKPALRTITRVATILVIVLFIASHFFFAGMAMHHRGCWWDRNHPGYYQQDSAWHSRRH